MLMLTCVEDSEVELNFDQYVVQQKEVDLVRPLNPRVRCVFGNV